MKMVKAKNDMEIERAISACRIRNEQLKKNFRPTKLDFALANLYGIVKAMRIIFAPKRYD